MVARKWPVVREMTINFSTRSFSLLRILFIFSINNRTWLPVKRRVSYTKQELLILIEQLGSSPAFYQIYVACFLSFLCCVFCFICLRSVSCINVSYVSGLSIRSVSCINVSYVSGLSIRSVSCINVSYVSGLSILRCLFSFLLFPKMEQLWFF